MSSFQSSLNRLLALSHAADELSATHICSNEMAIWDVLALLSRPYTNKELIKLNNCKAGITNWDNFSMLKRLQFKLNFGCA